jgi:hypothetical protein
VRDPLLSGQRRDQPTRQAFSLADKKAAKVIGIFVLIVAELVNSLKFNSLLEKL